MQQKADKKRKAKVVGQDEVLPQVEPVMDQIHAFTIAEKKLLLYELLCDLLPEDFSMDDLRREVLDYFAPEPGKATAEFLRKMRKRTEHPQGTLTRNEFLSGLNAPEPGKTGT